MAPTIEEKLCTANTTGWGRYVTLLERHGAYKLVVISVEQNERPEHMKYQSTITKARLKYMSVIVTCNVLFASEGVVARLM